MEGLWLVSYVALWLLVCALAIVALAHSRLLGLLHIRVGPAAAKPLSDGPEIGTKLTGVEARLPDGSRWFQNFPTRSPVLLVFLSPQCETCDGLIPHLKDFARRDLKCDLVLISVLEDVGMNQAYIRYRSLEGFTYVISQKVADRLNIQGTPYALAIDSSGVVTAKGIVNHYEHLVSLLAAPTLAAESNVNEDDKGEEHGQTQIGIGISSSVL